MVWSAMKAMCGTAATLSIYCPSSTDRHAQDTQHIADTVNVNAADRLGQSASNVVSVLSSRLLLVSLSACNSTSTFLRSITSSQRHQWTCRPSFSVLTAASAAATVSAAALHALSITAHSMA